MSKDQKQVYIPPVDNVEKVELSAIEIIEWISTTINYWHLERQWPTNLIFDVCDEITKRRK